MYASKREGGRQRILDALLVLAIGNGLGQGQDQDPPSRRPVRAQDLLPIDISFFDLAAATGGDFYFWSPGEFAAADLCIPAGGEPLLLAYGELEHGLRSFVFPVDGATGRIELFAGAQRLDRVRIRRPSGADLDELDPASDWQRFERMRLVAVELPEVGSWRIELAGAGRFSLSVHAARARNPGWNPAFEPLECVDFDFVEERGRPGHEGLFPLDRDVRPGERLQLELVLAGSPRSAEALFVGLDGVPLGNGAVHELRQLDNGPAGNRLLTSVVVPGATFRVLVRGLDASGAPYQRVLSSSVTPRQEADRPAAPGSASQPERMPR